MLNDCIMFEGENYVALEDCIMSAVEGMAADACNFGIGRLIVAEFNKMVGIAI